MRSATPDLFTGTVHQCEICGKTLTDPESIARGIGPICACKDGGKIHPITDRANYGIVTETDDYLVIRDLGPWNEYKTVTNAAEWVVSDLGARIHGRRLYYYDSAGRLDQLKHDNAGGFVGFAPGGPSCTNLH